MLRRLYDEFSQSSTSVKIAISAVIMVWSLIIVTLIAGAVLFLESPGQAMQPTPGGGVPTISIDPASGPPGTAVTTQGQGWEPGQVVLLYLVAPGQTEAPNFASAGSTADAEGRFTAKFVVPSESDWQNAGLATVVARANDGGASAQAFFNVVSAPEPASPTPEASEEPTPTPTEVVPATPTATLGPQVPTATADTDLNIRGGPSTNYAVLGLLRAGQSAEITGISPNGGWWQIKFSGSIDGRGWISARYASAQNTGNVPVVQPPPPPVTPTPTPTATPPVITEWRAEYYKDRTLSGNPALVRNDVTVNFDWGAGSPASGLPADSFSARWSRTLSFSAGTYRFYTRVDDGVRLWIDGNLVIDQWHDSAPVTYSADVTLSDGAHSLRMEYYEHTGNALAQLAWERVEHYPDWKGEYYNNRDLRGNSVLVRNDVAVGFDWGSGSPGAGIPADNFSARWTRRLNFSAGTYRFYTRVDDGVRLWVDDRLIIDEWHDSSITLYSADVTLIEGTHSLRMEYYEHAGDALAQLAWERVEHYPDWKAEYFDNRKLKGDPVLVRNETEIDHDWGSGSPASRLPADDFSARWTRKVDFKKGTYLFKARVDDGVRLWVDDTVVLDSWRDGSARWVQAEHQVSKGEHRVKVEYYEHRGGARIEVDWERLATNQAPNANPGGPYTVDEGSRVVLDGSGSKDPDGRIVEYEWDFDYDGYTFHRDATGVTVGVRYPDGPARITVALLVTDDQGAAHLATAQISVRNVAPTAGAGGPYVGQVGAPISFAATAADPGSVDQAGLTYRWDFGDGAQASGPIVSHSYAQPGAYTLKLAVSDKDGGQGFDTAEVEVSAVDQPPTAIIDGPTQGLTGEALRFSGSGSSDSDGQIVAYAWDFDDGSTGSGVEVTHTYKAPGAYQIILTVTDDDGLTGKATRTVGIEQSPPVNQPPVAVIAGPTQGLVGQTLRFDGGDSTDSDGQIVDYTWDFDDGGVAKGAAVDHIYQAPGSYRVTLRVTDDGGLTDQTTHAVEIGEPAPINHPPTAVIDGPTQGLVSETLRFDGSGSSDEDGQIVDYIWYFGDGATGNSVEASHTYNLPGTYQVALTVIDDGGLTAKAVQGVEIQKPIPANQPPMAVIDGPLQGPVGQALYFSGSGSGDNDGQIVAYAWDFGDGATASGVEATYTYNAPGNYQVALTVTDDGGLTGEATHAVRIDQPAQVNQPPVGVISATATASVSQTIRFDGSGSFDPDGQIVRYDWDFGDGTVASGMTVTHVYTQAGVYQVALTVIDDGGLTAVARRFVQIEEPVRDQLLPLSIGGPDRKQSWAAGSSAKYHNQVR